MEADSDGEFSALEPAEAREHFLREGYLVVRRFLDPARVREVEEHVARYIAEVVPRLDRGVYYEDPTRCETLKQLQNLHESDPFFAHLFQGGDLERLAEIVLDGPVIGKNVQYFRKPPGGAATPPHQDGQYFMIDPLEAVTMWLALDEVDETNGCLRYVPRSHLVPLRPHARTDTLGFSQAIVDYSRADRAREVCLPASPGDLILHHAGTIHRADGNGSQRFRRALGFIYYAAHAREDVRAHAAYQETLQSELRAAGRA